MFAALSNSCIDNVLDGDGGTLWEGDGRQVDVMLPFKAQEPGEVQILTKLTDAEESYVNDLYVMFFKATGTADNPVIGDRIFSRYYTKQELVPAQAEMRHEQAGVVPIENIPTGDYCIVAVANVRTGAAKQNGADGNGNPLSLYERLQNATTWDKMVKTAVQLQVPSELDRVVGALVMGGFYREKGDYNHAADVPYIVSVRDAGTLSGYIHLERVDSKNTFNIYPEIPNANYFEILNWQICNMPVDVPVISGTDAIQTEYVNSVPQPQNSVTHTQSTASTPEKYSFIFYLMENLGVSKNGINRYGDREEYVTESAQDPNDPQAVRNVSFKNAPGSASYLKLKCRWTQMMYDHQHPEGYTRVVEATYTIHLGYCDDIEVGSVTSKANDFNCYRNTKYTYNVHIKGGDDIVVEAEREGGRYNNGSEGLVIDAKGGQIVSMDSHYGVFNVEFTPVELSNMEIILKSQYNDWNTSLVKDEDVPLAIDNPGSNPDYINWLSEDYQAIRLAPNSGDATTLVSYSETYDLNHSGLMLPMHGESVQAQDGTHTVPVMDMISLQQYLGFKATDTDKNAKIDRIKALYGLSDVDEDTPLRFTLFVNEYYYYYNRGLMATKNGGTVSPNSVNLNAWKDFSNKADRQFIFLSDSRQSRDGESLHITAKLTIDQKAIQTYVGDRTVGLALEHVNEHHWKNICASRNFGNTNSPNGYEAVTQYMSGEPAWSDFADQKTILGDNYPAFSTKHYENETSTSFSSNTSAAYSRGGVLKDNKGEAYWLGDYEEQTGFPLSERDLDHYDILEAATSRNRDLNRDGKIQTEEIKWFTPTVSQLVQCAIAARPLKTPLFSLFEFDDRWGGTVNSFITNGYGARARMHTLGINRYQIWLEEGMSTGPVSSTQGNVGGYAWEIRCMRFLGEEIDNQYGQTNRLEALYTWNPSTRVLDLGGYHNDVFRQTMITSGAVVNHHCFEYQANTFYPKFRVSKQKLSINNFGSYALPSGSPDAHYWSNNMADNYDAMSMDLFAQNYYENEDESDKGLWRMPTQAEMALMYFALNDNGAGFSCTQWYFNKNLRGGNRYSNNEHFIMQTRNGNISFMQLAGDRTGFLVRDYDDNYDPADLLEFRFGELTGTDGNYTVRATMNSQARVTSVNVGGVETSATRSGSAFSADASGVENPYSIKVTWNVQFNNRTYIRSKVYVLKNTPFHAFRDNNVKAKAVTVGNDLSVLRLESEDDSKLPDDCRWVLLIKDKPGFVNETPVVPTNGSYLSTKYILYNIGTAQYLGPSSNGTNNANNFTMVSDRSQALEFDLGGNNWGKLFRVSIGGTDNGYFDRPDGGDQMNIGVRGNLRHSWYFTLRSYVSSITLDPTSVELMPGQTATISATALPLDAANRNVSWSSDNLSVATVNNGVVTAVGPGTATITATAADGNGATATCAVTVKQPVTSITLSQTTATINVNNTVSLTATVAPANATNKAVTWSSNSTGIATVSESGVVTGKAPGTATITATAADGSGVTATCTVTVKQPVTSITLPATASVEVNKTITLTPTILPDNASDKSVTWSTSNATYATVSNGVVTGKAAGTVTITATANDGSGVQGTCTVTVKNPDVKVTGITLNQTSAQLPVGYGLAGTSGAYYPAGTLNLSATVAPANATNKGIKWTSSDTGLATVENGVVKARSFGYNTTKSGTVTITAEAADGSGVKATCTVDMIVRAYKIDVGEFSGYYGSVSRNNTKSITIVFEPSNTTIKQLECTSSNTSYVTATGGIGRVSIKGIKTGGSATITVRTTDGSNKTCSFKVTCK